MSVSWNLSTMAVIASSHVARTSFPFAFRTKRVERARRMPVRVELIQPLRTEPAAVDRIPRPPAHGDDLIAARSDLQAATDRAEAADGGRPLLDVARGVGLGEDSL